MLRLAQKFFDNQHVEIDKLEDFFNSDLCFYFEKLYKTKMTISNNGFIKIIRRNGSVHLYENVFYNWGREETAEYLNFEGITMRPGFIRDTEEGKQLSQKGYCIFENDPNEINRSIKPVTNLDFNPAGCDRPTEPNAMFKYSKKVWGEIDLGHPSHVDYNAYSLFRQMEAKLSHLTSFSNVLLSMDAFDMICLKWREGRSILPHNDLDIRMFVNLISYYGKVYEPRYLKVGEYDWYDYVFYSVLTDSWEQTNNIQTKRQEIDKIESHDFLSPMVNVFNPRFYHEVTPLSSGEFYSISAHKSFKKIVSNLELAR